jgi:CBS domain-containing protein
MNISTAMTREVLAVPPETQLSRAEELMTRRRIRHLPVVRDGRLMGILSDRDVLKYEALADDEITVGAAMTPAPITCEVSTSVSRAAEIMLNHKIDCVPVVDPDGFLVGIVTSSDLLTLLLPRGHEEILPFRYELRVVADGDLVDAAG